MERKKEWGKKTQFHSIYEWWDLRGGGYGEVSEIFNFIHENKAFSMVKDKPPPLWKKIP